jgi:hypothetical protein
MHQIPTDEALQMARLHQRERAAQAERDHLIDTEGWWQRPQSLLIRLIDGPVRLAAMMGVLIELIAIAAMD